MSVSRPSFFLMATVGTSVLLMAGGLSTSKPCTRNTLMALAAAVVVLAMIAWSYGLGTTSSNFTMGAASSTSEIVPPSSGFASTHAITNTPKRVSFSKYRTVRNFEKDDTPVQVASEIDNIEASGSTGQNRKKYSDMSPKRTRTSKKLTQEANLPFAPPSQTPISMSQILAREMEERTLHVNPMDEFMARDSHAQIYLEGATAPHDPHTRRIA